MNIFILDRDPAVAAQSVCDQHAVKMPTESTQMICTVLWKHNIAAPYKETHAHHPCVKWIMRNWLRWDWHLRYTEALFATYTARYKRRHGAQDKFEAAVTLVRQNINFDWGPLEPFVRAVPLAYHSLDVVEAYRKFYRVEKSRFARWRHGNKPEWM